MEQLSHFVCRECKCWNWQKKCVTCGTEAPFVEGAGRTELITALRIVSSLHDTMADNLKRTQARYNQLLDVAKRFIDGDGTEAELAKEIDKLRELECPSV